MHTFVFKIIYNLSLENNIMFQILQLYHCKIVGYVLIYSVYTLFSANPHRPQISICIIMNMTRKSS